MFDRRSTTSQGDLLFMDSEPRDANFLTWSYDTNTLGSQDE
jgi:hypothetical protein